MKEYRFAYGSGSVTIPLEEKSVKAVLSAVNWKLRGQNKHMLLLTPGRICTSSPELGVPTDFSDISEFDTILELAERRAGYMPELSYGSHIFQDLVEAEIRYAAVFEGESTRVFREDFFKTRNDISLFTDNTAGLEQVVYIHAYDHPELWEYYDISSERFLVARRA